MSTTGWIVLIVLGVIAALLVWLFNGLVWLRNQVKNAWSQIDVQLKRRHDLIPNLVTTAKGYMEHERDVLTRVTEARAQAMRARGPAEVGRAETALTQAVTGLFAVMEQYPQLKANENLMAVQEELVSTENRIGFARQLYNDMVARYNTRQEMFPANLMAAAMGFRLAEFFQVETAERALPKVDFGTRA